MTTITTYGHEEIALGERPLIICDVDEVALEFVSPFAGFLKARGYELLPRSFRLTGNIVSLESGVEAAKETVRELLDAFFAEQLDWQVPANGARKSLSNLSAHADIVFLTAMSPRHYEARRAVLDRHDLHYPLVATVEEKGPLISEIHDERDHTVVFIDDMAPNLQSAKRHLPHAIAINYMSNDHFRTMAPHPGDDIVSAETWGEIESIIGRHLGA
ncbi:MAG: hypothetical protein AAF724_03930 [Pseudomonadota bacterium]